MRRYGVDMRWSRDEKIGCLVLLGILAVTVGVGILAIVDLLSGGQG